MPPARLHPIPERRQIPDPQWPPSVIIAGRNRSGKTELARELLNRYREQGRRILAVVTQPDHLPELGPLVSVRYLATVGQKWPRQLRLCIAPALLNDVLNLAFRARDFVLFIDDADRYLRSGIKTDGFYQIAYVGRHRRIGYIVSGRRPKRFDVDVREAAHHYMLFQSDCKRTLAWLEDDLEIPAATVKTLEPYFFVHHDRISGQTLTLGGPNRDP